MPADSVRDISKWVESLIDSQINLRLSVRVRSG